MYNTNQYCFPVVEPVGATLPTTEPVRATLPTTEPVGAALPAAEPISVTRKAIEPITAAPLSTTSLVPYLNSPQVDDYEVDSKPLINTNNDCESTENSVYQLPPRSNCGKPPDRYSPEPAKKGKYPIANYMSTHRLSEACEAFVNQMSMVVIPTKVHDALSDLK